MSELEIGLGLQIVLWFQSWREPIKLLWEVCRQLGSEDAFLIALPLIYWCIDAALGRRLIILFTLNVWLNSLLKQAWHRPRPYEVSDQVVPQFKEASYGIPSGHAQFATLWGAIALRIRKQWVTWAVIAYCLLMAVARVGAGVHFPQDVIAGLLIGGAVLGVYAWSEPRITVWLKAQSLWMQIGLVVIVVAVLYAAHPLALAPDQAVNAEGVVSALGVLLGGGIGIALEQKTVRFKPADQMWKRAACLALGLALALGLRAGLSAAFNSLEPVAVFRLIRYAVIGLWLAFAAPWLFVRLKLADTESDHA
jgi:membrane-associated phospholipid phosphatase